MVDFDKKSLQVVWCSQTWASSLPDLDLAGSLSSRVLYVDTNASKFVFDSDLPAIWDKEVPDLGLWNGYS